MEKATTAAAAAASGAVPRGRVGSGDRVSNAIQIEDSDTEEDNEPRDGGGGGGGLHRSFVLAPRRMKVALQPPETSAPVPTALAAARTSWQVRERQRRAAGGLGDSGFASFGGSTAKSDGFGGTASVFGAGNSTGGGFGSGAASAATSGPRGFGGAGSAAPAHAGSHSDPPAHQTPFATHPTLPASGAGAGAIAGAGAGASATALTAPPPTTTPATMSKMRPVETAALAEAMVDQLREENGGMAGLWCSRTGGEYVFRVAINMGEYVTLMTHPLLFKLTRGHG